MAFSPAEPTQGVDQQERLAQLDERTAIARASLKSENKRLKRLLQRLAVDEVAARQAPQLREQGEVLKVQMHAVPRGADRVVLSLPWQPDRPIEVHLLRDLSPAQNVERLFRRARGFDQGLRIITERLAAAADRLVEVEALQARMADLRAAAQAPAASVAEIGKRAELWRKDVRALRLLIDEKPTAPPPEVRKVVRGGELPAGVQRFTSPLGRMVLAGRNASANDSLCTRLLRGRDRWFHVRDQTGAHVVLRLDGKIAPPEAELRACAILCAHLTGIAKGDSAEVTCAEGRHVRKVKGSAVGSVYVSDERVLRVIVDPAVVDAFYERLPPR